mgnify:CR=1 FL=1
MTKEFFYKNFQKTGQPFTDQSWAEYQNNYKILNDALTKLETLYNSASLENPQILDDSLFSFKFSICLTNSSTTKYFSSSLQKGAIVGD